MQVEGLPSLPARPLSYEINKCIINYLCTKYSQVK